MNISFTKNVEQYTTTQRNTRAKHFMEFTSKKQLEDANVLNAEDLEFVKNIKGTFSFYLHEQERYMAITLYKASNSERKYNFLVVDLLEKAVAEMDSIKQAKAAIMELVGETQNNEQCAPTEDEEEDVPLSDKKPSRSRKKENNTQEA